MWEWWYVCVRVCLCVRVCACGCVWVRCTNCYCVGRYARFPSRPPPRPAVMCVHDVVVYVSRCCAPGIVHSSPLCVFVCVLVCVFVFSDPQNSDMFHHQVGRVGRLGCLGAAVLLIGSDKEFSIMNDVGSRRRCCNGSCLCACVCVCVKIVRRVLAIGYLYLCLRCLSV